MMRAVCWYGTGDVRVETVPEPRIRNPRDAIIQIALTAICGSDLHLYDGYIPTMRKGDILGHEFMGEVVEVGKDVTNLRPSAVRQSGFCRCRPTCWSAFTGSFPARQAMSYTSSTGCCRMQMALTPRAV